MTPLRGVFMLFLLVEVFVEVTDCTKNLRTSTNEGFSDGANAAASQDAMYFEDSPMERIIQGVFAERGEFPGQVSVQIAGIHMYGGTIITNRWIMTTGRVSRHKADSYMVLAGTNVLLYGGTYHRVEEAIHHIDFDENNGLVNDIALLKLKDPIMLGVFARPVTLPAIGDPLPVGTEGIVVGWGWYRDTPPESNRLRKGKISITRHDKCNKAYSEFGIRIRSTQVCAEDIRGQTGPCGGDSGGPFIMDGKVVGIMSFSLGCVVDAYPNVLTDVSKYMEWIREIIVLHHKSDL